MTAPSAAEHPAHLRVALDAMGGDQAPRAAVEGALRALADGVDVLLVGDRVILDPLLDGAAPVRGWVDVVHASERIGMDEDPALALRAKRDASIRVAAQVVADGRAGALVSAGPTGATLAAGLLTLGRLPGVRRPAVAAVLPTPAPAGTVLLDAGASPDAQPDALVAFARMGSAYARTLGVRAPRVGLLNVGAERGKGSTLAREAGAALATANVAGLVGNVEPADVLAGVVDVVVTDGFTGNVFLKTLEACGLDDVTGPGAALLLGCAGPVLVAHGAAGPAQIAAALRTARDVLTAGLMADLRSSLADDAPRQEAPVG
jgi:glycerol-3-phosphate acyltransferase PlsX